MFIILTMVAMGQSAVGPLDGFRANYSAIRARASFEYIVGSVEPEAIGGGKLWTEPNLEFSAMVAKGLVGEWACDGTTEYYDCGSPGAVIQEDIKTPKKAGENLNHFPRYEMVFDGSAAAYHRLDDGTVDVMQTDNPGLLGTGNGPFVWWGSRPFPSLLGAYIPSATVTRRPSTRGGHHVEVEIHEKSGNDVRSRIEVAYDPSIGYLPRYARMVTHQKSSDLAYVKEMYLMAAEVSGGGGFVPSDWYETFMAVDGFGAKYPGYDDDTLLDPSHRASIGHFRLTKFQPKSGPVKLAKLDRVQHVSAIGGQVRLPASARSAGIDLGGTEKLLGKRLLMPRETILPHLDESEVRSVAEGGGRGWGWGVFIGVAAVAIAGVIYRRSVGAACCLALLAATTGCGSPTAPVVRLTAAFTKTRLIYDPAKPALDMTLVVKNEGNLPTKILSANGGCSCRRVDQARFPATLKPGDSIALAVGLHDRRTSEPQEVSFTFDTDQGTVAATAPLYALAANALNPEAPSNAALSEGDGWEFVLTHREVFETGAQKPGTSVKLPDGFAVEREGAQGGRVGGAPEFSYQDTMYRVVLKDMALGTFKGEAEVVDAGGRKLAGAQVQWKRSGFLNTAPDRVFLAQRPVRAFLRCPDDDVELDRVLSAPDGVKAFVSSPREVTIALAEAAPALINGHVEVLTTATGRGPLKIPVVRYSSPETAARGAD